MQNVEVQNMGFIVMISFILVLNLVLRIMEFHWYWYDSLISDVVINYKNRSRIT